MENLDLPLLLGPADADVRTVIGRVAVFVDLVDQRARGIHMSRLYRLVVDELPSAELTPKHVLAVLDRLIATQSGLSEAASLRVAFRSLVRRPALVSRSIGWRSYPAAIRLERKDNHGDFELTFEVEYSSTCPCSAALARQSIQEKFTLDFPPGHDLDRDQVLGWLGREDGIVATPHGQRSTAEIKVRLHPEAEDLGLLALIDSVEAALQTPVQAAVKRIDEQAFARRNGANPMFCEDAARRIHAVLDAESKVLDFWTRVSHHESLHAHDAVAIATKGLRGGYAPNIDYARVSV